MRQRQILKWTFRAMFWAVMIAFILTFVRDSTLPLGDQWTAIGVMARDEQFDYIGWEVNALAVKLSETVAGVAPYLTESAQTDTVRAYMADLAAAQRLEGEVSAIYADPNVTDPETASADQRAQRDALRADLARRQALVESILERQVTTVLRELGFAVAGVLLPPVSMHFTAVPNLLIVSPRDQIRFDVSINLDPMPVDAMAALEERIDTEQDVSSLIVPLGGIALYPAMILETTSIEFAVETFAHEWLHHYLFAFPLGYNYDFAGEARIINESTAQQFGEEVGRLVLERYYPDLVPEPHPPTPSPSGEGEQEDSAPVFDFGTELNETRVTVDQLLADGEVDEAETYMEERRRFFADNGYHLRKLNQAFFAFYGGYQTGSAGAGGGDPIGAAVARIRQTSATIHEWIITLRGITTRDELLRAAGMSPP
jgi:hypothetical protein